MPVRRLWLGGITFACVCAWLCGPVRAAERVYAAQVPGGAIRVLVVMTGSPWPAGGLRVEDASGAVLAGHVGIDQKAAAQLDAGSQNALRALQSGAPGSDPRAGAANAILALRLLSDWAFARAAGAGIELAAGTSARTVRVVLLRADGSVASTLTPAPVLMDPGPPPATQLHAEAQPKGLVLQWQTATRVLAVPAYAYTVARSVGTQREVLTPRPQLLTIGKPGEAGPFIDHAPPVESPLTYELRLIDVLGVPSTAVTAQSQSPDFAARAPPGDQSAKSGRGVVSLSWRALANPRASGLMVERAQLSAGPYEWLTPAGLNPRTTQFDDRNVLPGASYYYRVRTVGPDGTLGPAPDPVHALALAAAALPAPQGLAAAVGQNDVTLTWRAVPGVSLAGYILERRAGGAARWSRLNSRLLPGPRYVDVLGPSQGGAFEYRVTAVASDEGVSAASEILRVALIDSEPPPAPRVTVVSGAEGRVQIHFAAGEPSAKTAKVALLRSDAPTESGLVVGAPVGAATGVVEDVWVQAGRSYWYRLVAFDMAGNRSVESEAYAVRVGAVTLPTPKAPLVSYVAQPAPQATLSFAAAPAHTLAIVQVQLPDGRWRNVAGPTASNSAVDLAPPDAHASYRIVYVGESGGAGAPSAAGTPK